MSVIGFARAWGFSGLAILQLSAFVPGRLHLLNMGFQTSRELGGGAFDTWVKSEIAQIQRELGMGF